MATEMDLPPELVFQLRRSDHDPRPVVLMTCGIAGSGKSTIAKHISGTWSGWTRFSIDVTIFDNHGAYGIDYPASQYEAYQDEAEAALKEKFVPLLKGKKWNVVLDFSFAFRETRDEWRALIEEGGGRAVLVYLDANEELLWKRIQARKEKELNADSAAEITRETLRMYCAGFEKPDGEGEVVIAVRE